MITRSRLVDLLAQCQADLAQDKDRYKTDNDYLRARIDLLKLLIKEIDATKSKPFNRGIDRHEVAPFVVGKLVDFIRFDNQQSLDLALVQALRLKRD